MNELVWLTIKAVHQDDYNLYMLMNDDRVFNVYNSQRYGYEELIVKVIADEHVPNEVKYYLGIITEEHQRKEYERLKAIYG